MKIEVLKEDNTSVFDALFSGVREHNFQNMGPEVSIPLYVISRDENGNLIGGVAGRTIYKQFLIQVVWVDKNSRTTGLGRRLMELAEDEAKKRGCLAAQVDTLSFQGPAFYGKLGFEEVGKISGVSESPDRYFLMKKYQ
ncbi:GNAT family N-acetyltransferase [Aeromonas veronii]|uniref:GNAT family N-acetyltransferase n=1 Tax=Aeromonas veronii TaxID=654 RepID=UPI000946F7CA|nr:GNAT family N-acetyltransferase [Aeromonas veronii]OLF58435.1 GNAT family N-acetyltransferase [Aeromonas veronii]